MKLTSSSRITPPRKEPAEGVGEDDGVEGEVAEEGGGRGVGRYEGRAAGAMGGKGMGKGAQVGGAKRAIMDLAQKLDRETSLSVQGAEPGAEDGGDRVSVAAGADRFC